MVNTSSKRTSIIKITLASVLIVIICIAVGKLSLMGFKLPELVHAGSIGQELPEFVRQRIQNNELYLPHSLEDSDTVAFTELIQYSKQIYVAAGYIQQNGTDFPWFVIMKRLPFSDDYVIGNHTVYQFDNISSSRTKAPLWMGGTDIWFFASLDLYVSLNTHQIKGALKADFGRIIICLAALGGFYIGIWSGHRRKAGSD